ncbi:TPA: hypothetical protein JIZ13_03710 [Acinetobacter nosocomialis]|uniref:hypothetical protein n=1 Tax=Acinetobacter nosocomialis TaxID=106654 RepID=UPI0009E1149B|nr:hypothetical protein [Acinetobacter nosocomialis]ARG16344.1 hypothetical protein B7L44_06895 [Acinetobacter nosocomialis]HAV4988433.1 hypothetical protein [Acinetobacter nosocomialis]
MQAQQFIKDHGLERAREVVASGADSFTFVLNNGIRRIYKSVSVTSLKRLVESVDLVNKHGGIYNIKFNVLLLKNGLPERLKQAIADYESIYGEGNE